MAPSTDPRATDRRATDRRATDPRGTLDLGLGPNDDILVKRPPLSASLLRTARPKQWVKNILVFAAPASAGALFHPAIAEKAAIAFVSFCLASVATYFANDALDHKADRLHPNKRLRPIAAGLVGLGMAWSVAGIAMAGALAIAFGVIGLDYGLLILFYVTLTLSYSFWLKHVAVVDLVCVAAGFVLRMIGGGIATNIFISNWFLTVASFSSLFVVAGKRYAELNELGNQAGSRAVLGEYTTGFLRSTYTMAMAVSIASYCQWAFERASAVGDHFWYQLSAVPWVLGLLRYALLLDKGQGGAPEDVFISDRVIQIIGLLWISLFGVGVYAH